MITHSKNPHPQYTIPDDSAHPDLIVVGASSGGLEALRTLVARLPAHLQAAVLVVLHTHPDSPMLLADILNRAGSLPCCYARDGDEIGYGHLYLAPPDRHLFVEQGRLRLTHGPKENRVRPAVDPLFRSAAAAYGPRVIGVVLTGNLNDGSAGLWAVKAAGGLAVVQDPGGIPYPGMPQSALAVVDVDHVAPLNEIPALLIQLVEQAIVGEKDKLPPDLEEEATMERDADRQAQQFETLGKPSHFGCPECGGVLNELDSGGGLRFRCRVGHAYTAEALYAEMQGKLEQALWIALRTLEEKQDLQKRMANRATERGHTLTAGQWLSELSELDAQIDVLRQVLNLAKP